MLFDFATIASADRYRLLASSVLPRPIAWVVSQDATQRLNAAPFSFFNVFASDPATIILGVGARADGTAKDTTRNIRDTGEFVVNLVGHDNLRAMTVTAIDFEPGVDELVKAGLSTLPSVKVGPPRIAESPAALECRRSMMIDLKAGRTLIIGEVLAMHVRDDCVLDAARCRIDSPRLDLMGRMHGEGWYVRTTALEEMPRLSRDQWGEGK